MMTAHLTPEQFTDLCTIADHLFAMLIDRSFPERHVETLKEAVDAINRITRAGSPQATAGVVRLPERGGNVVALFGGRK